MAQHSIRSRCKDGTHPSSLSGQYLVANCIDTTMNRMQCPTGNARIYRAPPSNRQQLASGNDPMLPFSQFRNNPIQGTRVSFFIPGMNNQTVVDHVADRGAPERADGAQTVITLERK